MKLDLSIGGTTVKRLTSRFSAEGLARLGLFRPKYPPLAVEMGQGGLTLVRVDREKKQPPRVTRYCAVEVPGGSLDMKFGRGNLRRPADVATALQGALRSESIQESGISLVLPDHLARVSLLHLGERPAGRAETMEMIRWKIRKTVPFNVDDAHIDYQFFPSPGGGGSFTCLTTLVLRKVLAQYEKLFGDLDLRVGLIDLSTFTLVNLHLPVLQDWKGDALILNVTGSFFALMILRRGVPIFYRAKSYAFVDDASREARQDVVTREVGSSLAYYRERLAGSDPVRISLRCIDLDLETLAGALRERLGAEVVPVDPTEVIEVVSRNGDGPSHRGMLQRIAPALGAALGRES